jgi:predicted amidohydrolase
MHEYAEDFDDSPTLKAIKQQCSEHKMYAIGSIPRKQGPNFYNTAFVINPKG